MLKSFISEPYPTDADFLYSANASYDIQLTVLKLFIPDHHPAHDDFVSSANASYDLRLTVLQLFIPEHHPTHEDFVSSASLAEWPSASFAATMADHKTGRHWYLTEHQLRFCCNTSGSLNKPFHLPFNWPKYSVTIPKHFRN